MRTVQSDSARAGGECNWEKIQLRDLKQTGGGGGTYTFKGLQGTFYNQPDGE